MDVKGEVLLQPFDGTKTFLEPNFFSIYSQISDNRFSAPLSFEQSSHCQDTV